MGNMGNMGNMKKKKKWNVLLFIFFFCILFLLMIVMIVTTVSMFCKSEPFRIRFVVARFKEDLKWTCNLPFSLSNDVRMNSRILNSPPLRPVFDLWTYNKGCSDNEPPLKITCDSEELKMKKRTICLPNVGRCDHTFLYYIVTEYDDLPDLSIFLPASSNDPHKQERKKQVITHALVSRDTVMHGFRYSLEECKDFSLDEWKATNSSNQEHNPESKLLPATPRPFGAWFEKHIGLDRPIRAFTYFGIFAVHRRHILQHPKSFYENLLSTVDHHSNPEAGHYLERSWSAIFWPYPESCLYY
jgi:hypothetical protein